MTATFLGDLESAAVKMTFTNFELLGMVTKTVAAAQLNDTLFDDIGRFLTREPNNLMHEALSDAYRMQLRSKVQQDQIKRRWENKINEQQESELAQLKRDRSITGRFAARRQGRQAAAQRRRPLRRGSRVQGVGEERAGLKAEG